MSWNTIKFIFLPIIILIIIGICCFALLWAVASTHEKNKKIGKSDEFKNMKESELSKAFNNISSFESFMDFLLVLFNTFCQKFIGTEETEIAAFKKAEYIENIYEINGEEILYRFKEKTNVGKEVWALIVVLPLAVVYVFMQFGRLFLDMSEWITAGDSNESFLKTALFIGLAFCVISFSGPIIKAVRSKDTKSHKSWAISRNYFIQVYEGVIELEINKKDINYFDFNGYEIIVDLNPNINNYLSENEDDKDKIIMEDVLDVEKSYKILQAWAET